MSEVVSVVRRRLTLLTWYRVSVHDSTIQMFMNHHDVYCEVDWSRGSYVFDDRLQYFCRRRMVVGEDGTCALVVVAVHQRPVTVDDVTAVGDPQRQPVQTGSQLRDVDVARSLRNGRDAIVAGRQDGLREDPGDDVTGGVSPSADPASVEPLLRTDDAVTTDALALSVDADVVRVVRVAPGSIGDDGRHLQVEARPFRATEQSTPVQSFVERFPRIFDLIVRSVVVALTLERSKFKTSRRTTLSVARCVFLERSDTGEVCAAVWYRLVLTFSSAR